MKKIITLNEVDLNRIVKKIIKEQTLPPRDLSPNVDQGEFTPYAVKDRGDVSNDINLSNEIKLGKNLFKLGSSEIDTNSSEFKKALNLLKKGNISNAVVTPGVSGVSYRGKRSDGPRNIALGQNRAKSFINALKANGLTNINFTIESTIVGSNTIPNSPEANEEQFVIVKYSQTNKDTVPLPAIDNTATLRKPYISTNDSEYIPIPIGKDSVKICLQITVYKRNYYKLLQQIQMIKRFGTVKNIKCP